MLTIKDYVVVKSLEEAYELNQKLNNVILGGTGWLKLQNRNILKAIDLSELNLEGIQEDEEKYVIGCMTTLRELENNSSLNELTNGAIKESLRNIVGVQFRNTVTVGGSIYGRYGFSDVLTCLLTLDTYVELYKGGIIPLEEFAKMGYDKDILVNIIIKKSKRQVAYDAFRISSTDFPIITCGIAVPQNEKAYAVIGGRPGKAIVIRDEENILESLNDENIEKFADYVVANSKLSGNLKASKEYREALVKVYVKRTLKSLGKVD